MACYLLRMIKVEDASIDRVRDVINRQVGHMARLLDELLDVSRIARGKIKLQLERADVHGLLRTVCEDHRALLEQSGLSFECELGQEPLWIMLDVTRFAQIIGNLLHNACKFTEHSGNVTLTLKRDGAEAVVKIRDTGIGMDAATLAHAFEPFRQADTSLDRSRGGLGLGLSVVKGLIALHGGTITASSDGVGRGTTVALRVPLVEPPSQSRPVPHSEVEFVPKRILVVDDNRDTVELMASMLELEGYQVAVAHDGPKALERALEFSPNVVVCDIGLPGMSGYELARALRAQLPKSLRLIAITGYGSGPDRSRAFDAGFDEHLTKPVGHDVLRRVLRD
jgi:CheY-like chemotaxis protein/two-component sensor histidine kinase